MSNEYVSNEYFETFNKLGLPSDVEREVLHVTNLAQCIRVICKAVEQNDVSQSDCLLAASLLTAARINAGQELNAIGSKRSE